MKENLDKIAIGLKIKQIREDNKLSQMLFSIELSVSQQTISQVEKGIIAPSLELLVKITSKYCISLDSIVFNGSIPKIHANTKDKSIAKSIPNSIPNGSCGNENGNKMAENLEIENAYLRGKVDVLKEVIADLQQVKRVETKVKEKAKKTA